MRDKHLNRQIRGVELRRLRRLRLAVRVEAKRTAALRSAASRTVHEFSNHLQAIMMSAEILGAAGGNQAELTDVIIEACEGCQALVRKLSLR